MDDKLEGQPDAAQPVLSDATWNDWPEECGALSSRLGLFLSHLRPGVNKKLIVCHLHVKQFQNLDSGYKS